MGQESPQPQFLVRFFAELPELWKTNSRPKVRRLAEQVRQQAGQLLAEGTQASERHLIVQSLHQTLNRMSGELDKFSVVSWWEPVADKVCQQAGASEAAQDLLRTTLTKSLANSNPFIQLSALLALNRMGVRPASGPLAIQAFAEPAEAASPEMAEWINRLLAGEAAYPDPALFR